MIKKISRDLLSKTPQALFSAPISRQVTSSTDHLKHSTPECRQRVKDLESKIRQHELSIEECKKERYFLKSSINAPHQAASRCYAPLPQKLTENLMEETLTTSLQPK